jgi:hypothetical protein
MTPTYFCDFIHCEKDLALDLYNFEFPLPMDDLYQVWLKLDVWFWRKLLKILSECLFFAIIFL